MIKALKLKTVIDSIIAFSSQEILFKKCSDENIEHLPVINMQNEIFMCITKDGKWGINLKTGFHYLNQTSSCMFALPLLEKTMAEIEEKIDMYFQSLGVKIDAPKVFPFIEIIIEGLEFCSDYWAKLAFSWYDNLLIENKYGLKPTLEKIENEKWLSQKLHHKCRREIKNITYTQNPYYKAQRQRI